MTPAQNSALWGIYLLCLAQTFFTFCEVVP
jgi:hypothetical protein